MKKSNNLATYILTFMVIALLITTIFLYQYNSPYLQYFIYLSLILLLIEFVSLMSRFQRRKQLKHEKLLEARLGLWNSISYKVKKAGEKAFSELPIGILVINNRFDILWANNQAKRIFMSPLEKMNLSNIEKELVESLELGIEDFNIDIYGQIYQIDYLKQYNVIYLSDITEIINLKNQYLNRTTSVGYINIDNLEEALTDFDVQERAEYMGKIIGIIAKWAENFGIYVRAYSENRYLILMDYAQLTDLMKSNFAILDDIKTIFRSNRLIRITLSMGISCLDQNIVDVSKDALMQLELALNRGGDQAIININDKQFFFGAKTDATPKDSKVEVRVKSEELQELIRSSSNVMVMGHSKIDADGFGATLGIYKLAKSMDKTAYMILDSKSMDPTVERIYETIVTEYVGLLDDIISPNKALRLIDSNTLLVVVDCQSEGLVIDAKVLKKASKVGVIDHHRKGHGAIKNPDFYYSQPSASSSVELVVELLQFYPKEIDYDALEATWMLLGIIVDTNNFIYRASEKTFNVAAILKKHGADMMLIKKYLKEDITEKIARNEFIDNIEIYKDRVGISASPSKIIYERSTLAKISDEIITITGLTVGITIGYIDHNLVGISARSLGDVNVQMLMERIGGGGHLNNAAAQIVDKDIPTIIKEIKYHIDDYLEKEDNMKVILVKEVKGRGKRGDVIDLQPGFANHLIRTGQAVIASNENIKMIELEKRQMEIQAEKHLQEMKELKKTIEATPIKIAVRVGNEGKLFGTVSMKQVVDTFAKETGITLDKRKINFVDNITSLGTFDIPIQLHKEVVATIRIFVIEKE